MSGNFPRVLGPSHSIHYVIPSKYIIEGGTLWKRKIPRTVESPEGVRCEEVGQPGLLRRGQYLVPSRLETTVSQWHVRVRRGECRVVS
ncbi:hypothetical protein J6590_000119 [Homalodisca vitripennis]|nr:hypothetical protein J6590_000119 [Homalodisca vitripennis]